MSTTPPDRAHLSTEQRNPRSTGLHRLSVADCVRLINEEDRTVPGAVAVAMPALTVFIQEAEPRFNAGGRLIYIGAGTSGRLGVLDASECPPTFQVPPERVIGIIAGGDRSLRRSSEGKEDDANGADPDIQALGLTGNDSLLGIATGGTTPYVLGAMRIAKEIAPACLTGLLACVPRAKPESADHLIVLNTGPELLTGSTRMKAGTATKLALNTISTTLMVRSGRVYENLMVDLRATNDKLRDRAARIITTLTGLERQQAFLLLDQAAGEVKTAIVMHRLGLESEPARAAIARARGRLDALLGSPDKRTGLSSSPWSSQARRP
jgi:N-acetylmuramic acid 6-phosphate etherase